MQITFNFSEQRFIPAADNQKSIFQATRYKVQESLRTFQGLAHKFKDFPRTPPKIQGLLKTVQTLLLEGGYAIYNKAQHLQSFYTDTII